MERKKMNKEILENWKPVHLVVVVDGKIANAIRCVFYIGGKGYQSYYSLFSTDDKHIGFVKHCDVKPYMSNAEIIV